MNIPLLSNIAGLTEGTAEFGKNFILSNGQSLMKLLKPYIIEPTIFVTNNARFSNEEKLHDVISEQIDLFACFYTQAFKVLTQINGVEGSTAIKLLSSSGYDYDLGDLGKEKVLPVALKTISNLSFDQEVSQFINSKYISFGNESKDFATMKRETEVRDVNKSDKKGEHTTQYGYQIRNFIIKTPVLVRKASDNGNFVNTPIMTEIPITIKANIVFVPSEELYNAIEPKSQEKSFVRRWDEYRAGSITLTDLIFCGDLVNSYKDNLIKDKSNIIKHLNGTQIHAMGKAIGNKGRQGYDRFYNMYVVTKDESEVIERRIKGRLDNNSTKEDLFMKLNALQFMVLDNTMDVGVLYLKDISKGSVIPYKYIGRRKENSDISEVMKSLFSNKMPQF